MDNDDEDRISLWTHEGAKRRSRRLAIKNDEWNRFDWTRKSVLGRRPRQQWDSPHDWYEEHDYRERRARSARQNIIPASPRAGDEPASEEDIFDTDDDGVEELMAKNILEPPSISSQAQQMYEQMWSPEQDDGDFLATTTTIHVTDTGSSGPGATELVSIRELTTGETVQDLLDVDDDMGHNATTQENRDAILAVEQAETAAAVILEQTRNMRSNTDGTILDRQRRQVAAGTAESDIITATRINTHATQGFEIQQRTVPIYANEDTGGANNGKRWSVVTLSDTIPLGTGQAERIGREVTLNHISLTVVFTRPLPTEEIDTIEPAAGSTVITTGGYLFGSNEFQTNVVQSGLKIVPEGRFDVATVKPDGVLFGPQSGESKKVGFLTARGEQRLDAVSVGTDTSTITGTIVPSDTVGYTFDSRFQTFQLQGPLFTPAGEPEQGPVFIQPGTVNPPKFTFETTVDAEGDPPVDIPRNVITSNQVNLQTTATTVAPVYNLRHIPLTYRENLWIRVIIFRLEEPTVINTPEGDYRISTMNGNVPTPIPWGKYGWNFTNLNEDQPPGRTDSTVNELALVRETEIIYDGYVEIPSTTRTKLWSFKKAVSCKQYFTEVIDNNSEQLNQISNRFGFAYRAVDFTIDEPTPLITSIQGDCTICYT